MSHYGTVAAKQANKYNFYFHKIPLNQKILTNFFTELSTAFSWTALLAILGTSPYTQYVVHMWFKLSHHMRQHTLWSVLTYLSLLWYLTSLTCSVIFIFFISCGIKILYFFISIWQLLILYKSNLRNLT